MSAVSRRGARIVPSSGGARRSCRIVERPRGAAALRFEPGDGDADLLLHVIYTEAHPGEVMERLAGLRRRQARLGRYPAYDSCYETVMVSPYQRINPFEYDFEPGKNRARE